MNLRIAFPYLVISIAFLVAINTWINYRQPKPYMDEVFHIPQAREFCDAITNQRWPAYHPSITTLPALYVPNAILAAITRSTAVCSTQWLRTFSAVMALLCLPLIVCILQKLRDRTSAAGRGEGNMNGSQAEQTWDIRHVQGCREAWAAAFFIWLHPVFLFYAHLFYTDTSSVFWLLLSWNLSLRNDMMGSAVAGLFSSLTRQTNMIWHAYIVFDSLIHTFLQCKRTTNRLMIDIMNQFPRLLYQNWAHVIVGVIYASFLFVNGGVAIGDKSHHQVSLHYAMLPYFLGFHALSYAPLQLLHPRHLAEDIRLLLRPAHGFLLPFASACAGLCAMVMATGDAAHAFILADNRHFTFYIYRRWLLRSELRRVILVPLYAWGVVSPFLELVNGNSASASNGNGDERRKLMYHVSDVVLLLCAGATLIPSPLLEPRYFVVAHMLLCMQRMSRLQRHCAWKLGWLSTGLITANVALVYVFAEMPFERRPDAHMPSDDSPGRFMF